MRSRLSTLVLALALALGMTVAGAAVAQTTTEMDPTTTAPESPDVMSEPGDVIEIDVVEADRKERRAERRRRERRRRASSQTTTRRGDSPRARSRDRARQGKRRARARKRAEKSRLSPAERRRRARARLIRRRAVASVRRADYVFPVFGKASFSNDYGAWRASTGRSHEGNDIFAPFGAPILAVADGTLYKVGTLPISGNRLWLIDGRGHTFFYAHLSAFSHRAVNGAVVRAGEILGFTGSTGDAKPTPPHLHFEVHPADGKPINPYRHLLRWRRVAPRRAPGLPGLREQAAPPPGVLVELRDLIAEQ